MGRFLHRQIDIMASRIEVQRPNPMLKRDPNVSVDKSKEPDAQRHEQARLEKFEDRDEP
jgi:hypothetical protein